MTEAPLPGHSGGPHRGHMTKDELVERVARAAYNEFHVQIAPYPGTPWEAYAGRTVSRAVIYRELARLALRAIEEAGFAVVPKEPTLEMALAGCERLRAYYPDEPDANHRAASWSYLAMLDAAPKVTE